MKPRYLAIVLITSLASASFTAVFVMFNSSYTNSALVHVKEISTDRETIDFKLIMAEITQIKDDQEKLEKTLATLSSNLLKNTKQVVEDGEQSDLADASEAIEENTDNTQVSLSTDGDDAGKEHIVATESDDEDKKEKSENIVAKVDTANKANDKKLNGVKKVSIDKQKSKEMQIAKVDKKIKSKKNQGLPVDTKPNGRHQYLLREFKKEERDPAWSGDAMVQIMDSISKDVTQTSEFVSMDCRTTFCRLKMTHNSKKLAGGFITRLGKALTWSNSTLEIFFLQEARLVTDIFIFRSNEL